jgi:acetyl esterase/lipase
MATLYLVITSLIGIATLTALIPGRALGWWVPLWFLVSTATNELAVWGLILHLFMLAIGVALFDPGDALIRSAFCVLTLSCLGTFILLKRHFETGRQLERALQIGLPPNFEEIIPIERRRRLSHQVTAKDWLHPISFARHGVKRDRNIAYAEAGKRNLLDIFTPIRPGTGRPVLLQIHGGAWLVGNKEEQALPLMHHMASLGWVVVAINYRLSPRATFPEHIIDVKKAIAWVRENIHEWGGNPDFISVTGGSAGGHLTALAAMSGNYAPWQPGFEAADTRVQAAMPLYGVYDFCNRAGIRHGTGIDDYVMRKVMKSTPDNDPEAFDRASPVCWVDDALPPLFLIHGSHDTLVWVEEARRFVAELSAGSSTSLVYAELHGAQHAFETVHSPRTSHYLNAAAWWLEWAYADWCAKRLQG